MTGASSRVYVVAFIISSTIIIKVLPLAERRSMEEVYYSFVSLTNGTRK